MRFQYGVASRSRLALLVSASVLAMASFATSVAAKGPDDAPVADQAMADAPVQDGPTSQLEEVVVTAERRPLDLQKAPLSVSAISAETLGQGNITDITGLNGLVPGLVVARSGGAERIISIRGIGSETPENTNTQPGVSLHVDGVYIFNSISANAAFIDVAQVEVLRGPQGTMFGQGSTGGTINVVTNQPRLGSYTGAINLGAGDNGLFKGDAAVNVPLGDQFALRGAVQSYRHDGYSVATGVAADPHYALDEADETGWKLAGLWQPTDDFSFTLSTIQYQGDTHGPAQKNILDPDPDPRRVTQDYPARSVVETELYSGVAKWSLPWATLTSISGYQKLFSEQSWDSDALTAPLFFAQTFSPLTFGGNNYDHTALWRTDTESYSQEFNLVSKTDGPFTWIAGAVYLESKNSQYIVEYRAGDNQGLRPALPTDTPFNDPRVAAITYAELSSITRKSWATYFQGAYALTDQLTLTAGLRYNKDEYSGDSDTNFPANTAGAYLTPQPTEGLDTEEVTGKLALDYQMTPQNLIYASYTRGYKPGGINSGAAGGGAFKITPTFVPETVDSFEVGSKNRFLDNTAQLNLSGFIYKYKDMQFLEEDPILFGEGISNAPSAQIYGLEAEGSWLATSHLKFDASLSLLHGEFDEDYFALDPVAANAAQTAAGYPGFLFYVNFFPAVLARDAVRQNINGNTVPKLPEVQGAFSATYTDEFASGLVTAKVEYIYRDDYQYRLFNQSSTDTTPAYDVVNLFFKYEPDMANWSTSLTVTNLFDEDGVNSRFSDPYGSAQTTDTFIAPRQLIASVGYKF